MKKNLVGGYYDPSCQGNVAKQLVRTIGVEGEDGWLEAVGFKDTKWVKRTRQVWDIWGQVLHIGRMLEPTVSEQRAFGPLCRRLYR
jgi:hypothetical protein